MARELKEETIRKALQAAGHGPAYCDTWGGSGLIGFYTRNEWRTPDVVSVGFGFGVGLGGRFPDGAIDIQAIRPVYLEQYAYDLQAAGYQTTIRQNQVFVTR